MNEISLVDMSADPVVKSSDCAGNQILWGFRLFLYETLDSANVRLSLFLGECSPIGCIGTSSRRKLTSLTTPDE